MQIYHNPRCSKSRKTLQVLQGIGHKPNIRLYLEEPPTEKELDSILKALKIQALELIRKREDIYKELVEKHGLPNNKKAKEWMIKHPILIERPIVINKGKAKIGRPPENVLEII